jgi:hypothetical protein
MKIYRMRQCFHLVSQKLPIWVHSHPHILPAHLIIKDGHEASGVTSFFGSILLRRGKLDTDRAVTDREYKLI